MEDLMEIRRFFDREEGREKIYRQENWEKIHAQINDWKSNNKDKNCGYVKKHIEKNPRKYYERVFKSKYNITVDSYISIMIGQEFRCAICDVHQSDVYQVFGVDHDHKCCNEDGSCGKCIRGLLCNKCNAGIGSMNDSVGILEKAIKYLNK